MAAEKLPKELVISALIMVFGMFPLMLDSTIVNVAVNSLAGVFSTNLAVIQWAVTGYVLATGVAVPFSGWLMQKYHGKHLFIISMCMFLVGSLLSGLSWSAGSLIVFRVLQGFAAGILLPTFTTLIVRMAGQDNLGRLMSLVSIPVVLGPILGPIIGGLIMEFTTWHWLFFVNLPIGIIGIILIQRRLPLFEAENRSIKLDWLGVALLAVASGALIYGITQVVTADGYAIGVISLIIGSAAFVAYAFYALKKKNGALIPLNIFRSKNFSASFVSLFLTGFALSGPMLLLPLFFQDVMGLSVISSALWLVPQGVGMLIVRPFIGKLTDRIGARYVVLPSIILTVIGTLPFVFFNSNSSAIIIWAVLLVRGMGVGGYMIPIMSDSFVGLERSQVPAASVATRIIQNVGAAFGAAVLATTVSSAIIVLAGNFTGAYHEGFTVSLIFTLIGIIPALFLTNKLGKKKAVQSKA